jgi:hypothetical protein
MLGEMLKACQQFFSDLFCSRITLVAAVDMRNNHETLNGTLRHPSSRRYRARRGSGVPANDEVRIVYNGEGGVVTLPDSSIGSA